MANSKADKKKADKKAEQKADQIIMAKKLPFATRHDLSDATRTKVVASLNQTLAEIFDLQSQVKQAHWNVKGPSFFGLHKLFDEIAESLTQPIDTVAERILSLGGFAKGTVRMAASASALPDLPAEFRQEDIVGDIADRVALAAKLARRRIDSCEDAGDKVTSDLFIEVVAALDKALYFLEAYQFRA